MEEPPGRWPRQAGVHAGGGKGWEAEGRGGLGSPHMETLWALSWRLLHSEPKAVTLEMARRPR